MKEVKIYKVLNKSFNTEEEAISYENEIKSDLNLRARNMKLFYFKMCGYPGITTAKDIINNFCHYHKFTFGKYKNRYIGEVMMFDIQYIQWLLSNVASFKLNKEENALLNTPWKYTLYGYSCHIYPDSDIIYMQGDTYNNDLIDLEEKWIRNT